MHATPHPLRLLHRLRISREGMTAVEFAFIAPVLLILLFAIIEFSFIMLVNNLMESATNISSRLGKTGFAQSGQSREETILQSVRARVGNLIDPDHLGVTTKVYSAFSQIGVPEPWTDKNGNGVPEIGEYDDINGNGAYDTDMGSSGYGGAGDIVVYTVTYPWSIQTPLMRELIGDNEGHITLSTKAVVKNEPYDH